MSKKSDNQHRWREWLERRQLEILDEAVVPLRLAWEWDKQHPRSYPMNTSYELWETVLLLRNKPSKRKTGELPAPGPRPKSLHDFLDENIVKKVFEQQHSASYEDTLCQAAQGFGAG